MKILRNFFWFCSGANTGILKRCPTEASKYVGIGGTVLFTGLFAGISASYALYTVFRVEWIAIAFGMFWGAMIFNLDRFIVSSMKKRSGFFREAGMALPRLALAVLLAFVISKPLELKIFEREILRIIDLQKAEQAFNSKVAVFQNFPEIEEAQGQIDRLQQEIREKEIFRNQKQEEYDMERFGVQSSTTSGVPGIGRNARLKEQQLTDAQLDLEQTRTRNLASVDLLNTRIRQLADQREQDFSKQRQTIDNYDGFAARIDALSILTQQSRAVFLANLFIILLFIAVETAPIFVKLISPRGPYDDLLEKHEHVFSKQRIREVTKLEQETYENLHILEERSKSTIRKELDVSRNTLREMTDAEIEIARKTIQQWKEMELKKIPEAILDGSVKSTGADDVNFQISAITPNEPISDDENSQSDVSESLSYRQDLQKNDNTDEESKG